MKDCSQNVHSAQKTTLDNPTKLCQDEWKEKNKLFHEWFTNKHITYWYWQSKIGTNEMLLKEMLTTSPTPPPQPKISTQKYAV